MIKVIVAATGRRNKTETSHPDRVVHYLTQ